MLLIHKGNPIYSLSIVYPNERKAPSLLRAGTGLIINGCWRCNDWMTSDKDLLYLKQDWERLKKEIEKASKLGMVRVTKEIQKDIDYLQIRINALEEIGKNG